MASTAFPGPFFSLLVCFGVLYGLGTNSMRAFKAFFFAKQVMIADVP